MNILTLGLAGLGLYLVMQPKKKLTVSYANYSKLDKGFKIIVPCKEFEIYNEEQSAKWAYDETIKLLEFYSKQWEVSEKQMEEIGDDIFSKAFGCKKGQDTLLGIHPKYYTWSYRLERAMVKAFVDSKTISEGEGNAILTLIAEGVKKAGLNVDNLNLKVEGPL